MRGISSHSREKKKGAIQWASKRKEEMIHIATQPASKRE
jgi:hypothetical protein